MIIQEVHNLIKEMENYGNPSFPIMAGPPSPIMRPPPPPQRPNSGLLKKALIGTGVGLAGLGALGYAANTGMINYPGIPKPTGIASPLPSKLPNIWV